MEERSLRLEVEALDVEDAPVAGLHQHGDPALPGRLADEELHVERVALLDDQVEPVEEGAEVVGRDPLGIVTATRRYGSISPIRRAATTALFTPRSRTLAGNAVEVGQLDGVEVGQPKLAGQALHGQDVGDRVAGAEADHADAQGPLPGLLGAGELVAVAVEPQRAERTRAEQPHHGPPPGVVDPALGLVLAATAAGGGLIAGELLALLGQRSITCSEGSSRRTRSTSRWSLARTSRTNGRHDRVRVESGATGPARVQVRIARELLGLEPQGQPLLGRAQLLAA